MSKTVEKIRSFIERHFMLKDGDGAAASGVVVAVSGGPDSIALLDILVKLQMTDGSLAAEADKEKTSRIPNLNSETSTQTSYIPFQPSAAPRLHIAHLDHKLRGRESAEDAEFVRRLAERLKLSITVGEADVRAEAARTGRGIEEVARELRYSFLLRTARATGCDRIATGHTMNDQAETFLIRLARGAGLRGLACMRPVTKAHVFLRDEGGTIMGEKKEKKDLSFRPSSVIPYPLLIRPLLCITREEVEAYCRERNLEFRTDATNLEGDYTRNRVRRDVLPALRSINPRAAESIARAAEIIATDEDALDCLASKLLDGARLMRDAEKHTEGESKTGDVEATAYSAALLLEQPVGLRRRMIIEAIRREHAARFGCGFSGAQTASAHIASVESLLADQASGKRVILPGGLGVWREFDVIVLVRSACGSESTADIEYKYEMSGARSQVEASGFHLTLERDQPSHLLKAIIDRANEEKQRAARDWMIVALDEAALPDSLIIRPRRAGERAHVVGQRKTKKLKNLMIDHKIPASRRSAWPVVTTPDDRFVWSPGLPPALEFAARDKSTRLAILRTSNI